MLSERDRDQTLLEEDFSQQIPIITFICIYKITGLSTILLQLVLSQAVRPALLVSLVAS